MFGENNDGKIVFIVFGITVFVDTALCVSPIVPRFSYLPLNYLSAFALALMLPLSLVALAVTIRRTWIRWIAGICAALVAVPVGLFCLAVLLQIGTGVNAGNDTAFQKIAELSGQHGTYRLYRTNGGAMTSFGLVLRREHSAFPGVRLVTELKSFYPASEGKLEFVSKSLGRLTVAPYGDDMDGTIFDFVD